jgi:hypothetical protein
LPWRADYSHTSDCSSFEIANLRLHILFEHDLRANRLVICHGGKPDTGFPDHALEAQASIKVDSKL